MTNFCNLCVVEFIKLLKRRSAFLAIICFIFLYIISLLIVNYIKIDNYKKIKNNLNNTNTRQELENVEKNIEFMKKSEDALNSVFSKEEVNLQKVKKYYFEYAINNNIILDNGAKTNYYKYDIIQELIKTKTQLLDIDINQHLTYDISLLNEKIKRLENVLNNDDFDGYINYQIQDINDKYQSKEIDETEKETFIYICNLSKKYEIGKYNEYKFIWKSNILEKIKNDKQKLSSQENLSDKQKSKLNDDILLNVYRLKQNVAINTDNTNIVNYNDAYIDITQILVMLFVIVIFIILAGSNISEEFSNGTIKQIFITPNKKYKILLSKVIVLVISLAFITFISSLLSEIFGNIFFGDDLRTNYLYVSNEKVLIINNSIYIILKFLSCDIQIIIYMFLSLLLSIVTLNTAAAVGITVFIYFGNIGLTYAINKLFKQSWVKYIPFNNFNIVDKLFPNSFSAIPDILVYKQNQFVNSIPLGFSLKYIIICLFIFIVISFLSFNKKIV